ncbi:MAG: type III-B CRISPR module RAMP protein Cmr4 [Kofleriaceae bacterium]
MTQSPPIASLLFLYAETPLHAGSGSALGAVDLPIQRERMSGLPMVQGSGVKGALRAELARPALEPPIHKALFGRNPPSGQGSDQEEDKAGAVSVLDARLLLFPVRTVWGGFAWVTSPMVLERLARDLELAGESVGKSLTELRPEGSDMCLVAPGSAIAKSGKLFLEDFEYAANESEALAPLAAWLGSHALPTLASYAPFRDRLRAQLAIVADDELQFLASHATEVITRVRIDDKTGTVADGALWTEEALPAESLLWSVVFTTDERPEAKPGQDKEQKDRMRAAAELHGELARSLQKKSRIRLGGDRSVGRGVVGVRLSREAKNGAKP